MTLLHRRSNAILPIHGNEYETPREFFEILNNEFNFVFDLACNEENIKTKYGYKHPYYDALSCDWPKNGWLWLNPPYKPLRPWIEKVQEQVEKGAKVVMLIPPVTLGCKYFNKIIPKEMRFVSGRIKFLINGEPMKANTRDSVVLIYDGKPKETKTIWIQQTKYI